MNSLSKRALDIIMDIQDASGLNRKKELLSSERENEVLQDILYFVFNPYIVSGIGKAKYEKVEPYPFDVDPDSPISGMLTYLQRNNTGRDKDVAYVKHYVNVITFGSGNASRYKAILESIITKGLKLGISTTTINKVFPNLIPGFGIQLACKWQDNFGILENQEVFVTEKLDGNRCFAHVENHKCTFYSRSGKEIDGLNDVADELSRLVDGWYDGELIARSFNETQSFVRRKGTKSQLVFNIFDYVSDSEVRSQYGQVDYLHRREHLSNVFKELEKVNYIKLVPIIYHGIFDKDKICQYLHDYTSNGSEGLMINLNSPYQFTRTNQLLKVKNMYTLDLPIIGVSEGRGEFAGTAGALLVEYKGYPVGVGSGLSKEDRTYFWNNKEDVIGRIIEVQAFEECYDKAGNISLRFPVYKRITSNWKRGFI